MEDQLELPRIRFLFSFEEFESLFFVSECFFFGRIVILTGNKGLKDQNLSQTTQPKTQDRVLSAVWRHLKGYAQKWCAEEVNIKRSEAWGKQGWPEMDRHSGYQRRLKPGRESHRALLARKRPQKRQLCMHTDFNTSGKEWKKLEKEWKSNWRKYQDGYNAFCSKLVAHPSLKSRTFWVLRLNSHF